MLEMAKKNVRDSFSAFLKRDDSWIPKLEESEEYIDFLNREISRHISGSMMHEVSEKGSRIFSSYFKITGNIERISDHAMNICGYSEWLKKKGIRFSEQAISEIRQMQEICARLLDNLLNPDAPALEALSRIAALEQRMDDMTKEYRNNMLKRIKEGSCSEEGSILYSEMLTDFERVGDHALNIAQEIAEIRLAK